MEKLGFSYSSVKEINPKIVYASISGFGQTGPYSRKPALDIIVQAMGGIMSVTGLPGLGPMRPGASLGDSIAGLFTSLAITSALFRRESTGQGEYIDISMLDCQVTMMENAFARYFATREIPGPLGSRHPVATPFQAFEANDGNFVIALLSDNVEQWANFCRVIERPELGSDRRYTTNLLRTTNYDQLYKELQGTFKIRPTKFWIEILSAAGIPCGPVNTIPEVINDPQVKHRRMISEIPHKELGSWKVANTPFNFSSDIPNQRIKPAPELSEHTEQILNEILGITPEEIEKLSNREII
jgi:CoA:oxalate CoA-transferase